MLRQLLTHKLLEPHSSFQLQRDINTDSVAIFGHRRRARENNSSAALAVGGCHSAPGLLRPDSAQIAAWMSARRAPCCAPTELRARCAARPPWQPSLPALARVRPRPPRRRSPATRPARDPGRHARARPAPVVSPLPARPETDPSPGWPARAPGPATRAQLWLQAAAARPPCCAPGLLLTRRAVRAHHAAHPLWLRTRSAARRSRRLTSPRAVAGGAENRVRASQSLPAITKRSAGQNCVFNAAGMWGHWGAGGACLALPPRR